MKHINAPFRICEDKNGETWIIDAENKAVCLISANILTNKEREEARLISAAPELLESLIHLVEGIESCGITGIFLDEARKAIKKAKGEK